MKKLLYILSLILPIVSFAQTGISTNSPDAATVLHVVAQNNNTGVLIPTLTWVQINAIASPTHSLLVYNTDKNKFMYNAGTTGTPIWTFVGDIPVVSNIATDPTTGVAGDVRYDLTTEALFYWKVGTGWTQLDDIAGP